MKQNKNSLIKIAKKLLYIMVFLVYLCQTLYIKSDHKIVYASSSSSEIVMELNTNRVLWQNNAYEKKFMASTTKILTAITIIENCNLDDIVTITKESVGIEGSSIYLEVGEKLSVKDLLFGLMLRSGNDCAETLALHCSHTIENFALLMNKMAKKIGALNSNFVNPHGLHSDDHYTTAYDLALISCYAMKNADFREIVSTKKVEIPFTTRNYNRLLVNKNKMLKEFEGSTGIKTGYTKKAGRCLVSSALRNGMEVICVVLNCGPMFERSKQLLSQAFNDYKNYKLVDKNNFIDFIPVEGKEEKFGVIIDNDIILPLNEYEYKNIEIKYNLPNIIKKGTKKHQEIGSIQIYTQNNLLFNEKVYTILDV